MIKEVTIKKSLKRDFDFMTAIMRKMSVYSASFLNKMNILPNYVTLFRFFIFGIGGAYCFFIGTYLFNLIGVVLLLFNFYFDLVDGDLARNYNKRTRLGGFLEDLLDPMLLNFVILSIVFNLFLNDNSYKYFGLFCLFGQTFSLKMSLYFQNTFDINCVEGNDLLEENIIGKKLDFFSFFVKELITPKNFFMSFFSNFRYYLILGAFLGVMPLSIMFYSIAINIRWIVLGIFLIILNSDSRLTKHIILIDELNLLAIRNPE